MTYTESARAQLNALQTKDHVRILALETSCDETAAAIIEDGRTIVSNIVFSQIDLHALYGGVVPEIASRAHVEACDRVIDEALRAANMRLQDIDALAVTYGPGLVGALLTGVSCMKGFSYAIGKPLIPKTRRTYRLPDGSALEVNHVDAGQPTAFWYAEVEYPTVEAARAWQPAAWGLADYLGDEVTGQPGQSMGAYWLQTRG